jgi:hypothetical protein
VLAKTCWSAAALGTAWLATRGMTTGFMSFDATESFVSARHAETWLGISGISFLVLMGIARVAFSAPPWSMLVLGGLGIACLLLTRTDLRFLMVPILWPTVLAAATGVWSQPPTRREQPTDQDL